MLDRLCSDFIFESNIYCSSITKDDYYIFSYVSNNLYTCGLKIRINMVYLKNVSMECAVYDTYVSKKDGKIMHFDVVVEANTPHEKAIEYGKEYLASVGQEGQKMTQEECQFCHVQEAPPMVENDIKGKGYYIQKMEGCPP
jgi:Domain of unknown function (DUF2024)